MYREFNLILKGYYRRQEREASRTRKLMLYILKFGGMGVKDDISEAQIWPLEMDDEDVKQMITDMQSALELLEEF